LPLVHLGDARVNVVFFRHIFLGRGINAHEHDVSHTGTSLHALCGLVERGAAESTSGTDVS
jgi:hypothetical protein